MTYRELQRILMCLTEAQLDMNIIALDPNASFIMDGVYKETLNVISLEITEHGVPFFDTKS